MAEKKINGVEYRVDRPLATEALKLQARLMRAAGGLAEKLPALIASRREGIPEEDKQRADGEAIAAITGVFSAVSPEEYTTLVGDIIGLAKVKRPSGHYDIADLDGDFSARLGDIIPVAFFVLREVFGDFFSGALANGARAVAASR